MSWTESLLCYFLINALVCIETIIGHNSGRAVFNWASKAIRVCFSIALLQYFV